VKLKGEGAVQSFVSFGGLCFPDWRMLEQQTDIDEKVNVVFLLNRTTT